MRSLAQEKIRNHIKEMKVMVEPQDKRKGLQESINDGLEEEELGREMEVIKKMMSMKYLSLKEENQ